ncbi:MAG: enoyl-CoA hydratase/isomerase family protein [Paracoccus sp. (in: a-proteobacteria)]|uniref:enoyl-CoA hydratase/isomerase family protein n=1 Tax=Paracoccus sp. TaxID=267 RepID=UPI0026E04D58|nr:enoyl-CoA hydratase/isomerase family protein [Paracoccus sp. (in: a-proteobacteria)]MDO5612499.1 enoyl-CoA hydratase/isomerase family protein [Paracoccus sp. (in: a-proteobacteria)]
MIHCTETEGLAILTIDRQDKANSLTRAMLRDLTGHLVRIADRPDPVRAVILTGAGKVFSAGADIDEARAGLAIAPEWEALSGQVAAMPCLTIAALNGTLAGGAFGMVLACDLRVAVPGARFFYPVMRLGFLPQPSDPGRMARLIGPSRTRMILMAGARIESPEALSWGLIDRISDDPLGQARELAADCLTASARHVAAIKAMTE